MKTRTTIFDSRISAIAEILNAAVNTDVEHQIPERYVNCFCDQVVERIWRCVSNAMASMELYGDADGFIFNMGGYIDTMYDIDKIRWHGFSDKQADELERCYPKVVEEFREIALDVIEMHQRCMIPYDIELAVKYMEQKPKPPGTFRNMEHIAWECRDGKLTAEDIYDNLLSRTRELMHYKEKEEYYGKSIKTKATSNGI